MSKARQHVHFDDKVVALGEEVLEALHRHIPITIAPINSADAAFAKTIPEAPRAFADVVEGYSVDVRVHDLRAS